MRIESSLSNLHALNQTVIISAPLIFFIDFIKPDFISTYSVSVQKDTEEGLCEAVRGTEL
jgi:hypothetical protein